MINLSQARVLLSNDDGINAPGLAVLERSLATVCKEVWTVAPEAEHSGAGNSLTINRPIRLRQVADRRFALDGTPTDCMLIGVQELLADTPPDLIVTGINSGANLADDMTHSGTAAAAMEGTLLGIPSVALSQGYDDRDDIPWDTAEAHLVAVLEKLVSLAWPERVLMNVNFPATAPDRVAGTEIVSHGYRKTSRHVTKGSDPRGIAYYWLGSQPDRDGYAPGTDLEAHDRGAITVMPVTLDMMHKEMVKTLRTIFP